MIFKILSSSSDVSFYVSFATKIVFFVSEGRPKRGRKRKYPQQSRADRKLLHNNNRAHINTQGNFVQEKLFNENLICSCRKRCTNNVPLELRKRLFTQFWGMGTFSGRCVYLLNCVPNKDLPKTRNFTYTIFGHKVCKLGLIKTLQINASRLSDALKKYKSDDKIADNRGQKTGGRNILSTEKVNEVMSHISSFPKYMSHYARSETSSKYLGANLNLSRMYRLYQRKVPINPVSKSTYKKIFYRRFNLRFKSPKKDTCKKCDIYKAKIENADENTRLFWELWHDNHLDQAELLQGRMKDDFVKAANDPELEVISEDMQKILSAPKMPTSIVYYKRQLNIYNLGIHVGSTGKGIFNVWLENEASKGTQEVGSCLKKYIEENIADPVKKLIIWADSCGGQNRSIRLVLMLKHVLQNHSSLKTISIRYLETGHTFLPNDSEFGDFECSLKEHERIFTDDQYIKIMKSCRTKNQFEVNRLSSDDFFSVRNLEELITNRKVDINKQKINWMETHEILLDKSQPNIIKMKRKINDEFQTVDIAKGNESKIDFESVELERLWPNGRPLSVAKLNDLKEMMVLVPEKYKYFYQFLDVVTSHDFVDDVDGFGATVDFELEEF